MREIAKNVFHLPLMPRNGINCYLIEDFLIDSGIRSSYSSICDHLKDRKLQAHILTHAHADHQGSSKRLCEHYNIPLWCHAQEVKNTTSGDVTSEYPNSKHLIVRLQRKYWAGAGYTVSKTLKENDKIGDFVVIETPGHSSGHICLFRERDGVLIAGDAATNMNLLTTVPGLHLPPDLFTVDKERNIQSLRKLAALKPQVIGFGHGPVMDNRNGKFERFVKRL